MFTPQVIINVVWLHVVCKVALATSLRDIDLKSNLEYPPLQENSQRYADRLAIPASCMQLRTSVKQSLDLVSINVTAQISIVLPSFIEESVGFYRQQYVPCEVSRRLTKITGTTNVFKKRCWTVVSSFASSPEQPSAFERKPPAPLSRADWLIGVATHGQPLDLN